MKAPREVQVTLGKNVRGVVAVPHSKDSGNSYEEGYSPWSYKAVILLHGQGGHRDYCYQKHLAHRLAAKLGVYSLRIDFRGCGDSGDNEDAKVGRIIEQDIEDVQATVDFMTDKKKNPFGMSFTVTAIVAHSRGGVAMFLWALEQDKLQKSGHQGAFVVPNLINCSARFMSNTIAERYPIFEEGFESLDQVCLRHGKFQKVNVPKAELVSLATPDLNELKHLSSKWAVLSVYGLDDTIIPITDCARYANALSRGKGTHQLELIEYADHNFYGTSPIEDDWEQEKRNPKELPVNKKNLVNYNYQVADIVLDYLQPENELDRFMSINDQVEASPRWKVIDGVSNFRDMGGWSVSQPTFNIDLSSPLIVKPGFIYRAANVARVTEKGIESLRDLGIKVIFDLRSDGECRREPYTLNLAKYGIKRIHAPVYFKDDYSPQEIALRYTNLMTCWSTYINVYDNMLEKGKESFRTIFNYIRDDERPFVFHCTAGKDRTGIIGMLILMLAGVDEHTIAKEYEMTAVGLKPDFPRLRRHFIETVAGIRAKTENARDLESQISQGRKNWSIEVDGFNNLISSRYEAMLSTIKLLNDKYGGVLSYMTNELGYSKPDLLKIFRNLICHGHDSTLALRSGDSPEFKHEAKI